MIQITTYQRHGLRGDRRDRPWDQIFLVAKVHTWIFWYLIFTHRWIRISRLSVLSIVHRGSCRPYNFGDKVRLLQAIFFWELVRIQFPRFSALLSGIVPGYPPLRLPSGLEDCDASNRIIKTSPIRGSIRRSCLFSIIESRPTSADEYEMLD